MCAHVDVVEIDEPITELMGTASELLLGDDLAAFMLKEKVNLTIPEGVTEIGDCAFENMTNLTKMSIPGSVASIGSYAFRGCNNLESFDLSKLVFFCWVVTTKSLFPVKRCGTIGLRHWSSNCR